MSPFVLASVLELMENASITNGSNFTLICPSPYNSYNDFRWFFSYDRYPASYTQVQRYVILQNNIILNPFQILDSIENELGLVNVTDNDEGWYTCLTTFTSANISYSMYLNVKKCVPSELNLL